MFFEFINILIFIKVCLTFERDWKKSVNKLRLDIKTSDTFLKLISFIRFFLLLFAKACFVGFYGVLKVELIFGSLKNKC